MKLYSADGSDLMTVENIQLKGESIEIQCVIMGALPMRAILRPEEIRRGMRFVRPGLVWAIIRLLVRRPR